MEEQVKNAIDAIKSGESIEASVETYMALPKAIRREVYAQLPQDDLKKHIRAASDSRRGIAARTTLGELVLTREAAKEQILRLAGKQKLMDTRKAKLGERVVELKKNAQTLYGDDFIAEVETALDNLE